MAATDDSGRSSREARARTRARIAFELGRARLSLRECVYVIPIAILALVTSGAPSLVLILPVAALTFVIAFVDPYSRERVHVGLLAGFVLVALPYMLLGHGPCLSANRCACWYTWIVGASGAATLLVVNARPTPRDVESVALACLSTLAVLGG